MKPQPRTGDCPIKELYAVAPERTPVRKVRLYVDSVTHVVRQGGRNARHAVRIAV
jgi:hypothetical protein